MSWPAPVSQGSSEVLKHVKNFLLGAIVILVTITITYNVHVRHTQYVLVAYAKSKPG